MSYQAKNTLAMKVSVVELSGRAHEVEDLKPTDTVGHFMEKVSQIMPPGYVNVTAAKAAAAMFSLVLYESILNFRDHSKSLESLGIKDGMALPIVRTSESEAFEFIEDVADEDRAGQTGHETVVRFAFTSESTCLLIQQTHSRNSGTGMGSFVWDICAGRCTSRDADLVSCTWVACFRRRRAGVERNGFLSVQDSGWSPIRQEKVNQFKEVTLNNGSWKRTGVVFQEGDRILGIRLWGRDNCAEAITLMSL